METESNITRLDPTINADRQKYNGTAQIVPIKKVEQNESTEQQSRTTE